MPPVAAIMSTIDYLPTDNAGHRIIDDAKWPEAKEPSEHSLISCT